MGKLSAKGLLLLLIIFFPFGCEREITSSEKREEPRINGKLFIDSYPDDAMIYVNGKISGLSTPDTLYWLKDTVHSISLRKFLYRDTTFQMKADIKSATEAFIEYHSNKKMLGEIMFNTHPDSAEVYLNGEELNFVTPASVNSLVPGVYHVKYTKKGFRDWENDFIVRSNTTSGDRISLEDTTIWIGYKKNNSEIPDNLINDIAVDSENNIWIATETGGLVKFNGRDWKIWNTDNSQIPSNFVGSLDVDDADVKWMATENGLTSFDGISFTTYTSGNSGLPDEYIYKLEVDAENKVWVCTFKGLAVFDRSSWTIYDRNTPGFEAVFIIDINTNIDGEIWACGDKAGIRKFDGISWSPVPMEFEDDQMLIGDNAAFMIQEPTSGKVWVGIIPNPMGPPGGLMSRENDLWRTDYTPIISRDMSCGYADGEDIVYIGTKEGLMVFRDYDKKLGFRKRAYGLYHSFIKAITEDKAGNIWIATYGGGISRLNPKNLVLPL